MICTSPWNHLAGMSVATFLVALTTSGQAQEQKFKAVSVKTPDDLTISAQDWGNPNGPEILFIHGFSQSHLSWIKQVTSNDLAKEFHMVTYDLRGHGNSDKPFEPERYKTSKYWGDEVQAVMDATGLKRVRSSSAGPMAAASWPITLRPMVLPSSRVSITSTRARRAIRLSSVRICAISPSNVSQLTSQTGKRIALRSATAVAALVNDGARGNTRSNSPG